MVSHTELIDQLASTVQELSQQDLRDTAAELIALLDQGGHVAVYDIIVLLKVVWQHEVYDSHYYSYH
jgi:hypothetical protein